MIFDETELIEFFGVLPEEIDPEEKEFFGSSEFHLAQDQLKLYISFSTHLPNVIIDLFRIDDDVPILNVKIQNASIVRIETNPRRLVVMSEHDKSHGSDPQLVA